MASSLNREIDNFFAVIHDLSTEGEEWESRPAWLEFAPNNVCNLRCIMCGQADGLPLEVMSPQKTNELLDQVLPHTSVLSPSALSEPMYANMPLIIKKCREHGVFLNFNTNATTLDGKQFREIADRLHKIWISFDSHVPEVFEKLRTPAKFDTVAKNAREILEASDELNVPVGFVSVLMAENAEHLDGLVDYLADMGAVESRAPLRVQRMVYNAEGCEDSDPMRRYSPEEICGFLDRAAARAEARGMLFFVDMEAPYRRHVAPAEPRIRGIMPDMLVRLMQHVQERYPRFCAMSSVYLKIEPGGDVYPCCVAPEELKMGNVNERSVEEIWNGKEYRDFRTRMFAGDYPEACLSCDQLVANPFFRK